MIFQDKIKCDSCKRNLTSSNGASIIGIEIDVKEIGPSLEFSINWNEIYPDLPIPININICYSCWLKNLGVNIKELKEKKNAKHVS